jgi:hypothetical protein
MMGKRLLSPLTLALCGIVATRVLFRSRALYDIDSVNFALALRRFDPMTHQPHPPGYFLYVCLGRLVNLFIPDANAALVAISVAASCGSAFLIYKLAREWYGEGPARVSLLLFCFSPLCWFHGVVALTYIVEMFFSAAIGLLCWRAYQGKASSAIISGAVLGIAAGFRPSSALLLGPLWLFSLTGVRARYRVFALCAAVGAGAAWFAPMVWASGGFGRYAEALVQLWTTIPGQRTALSSPYMAPARLLTIGWIAVLCFGAASPLFLSGAARAGAKDRQPASERRWFVTAWVAPGLLFFTFVFLNYVNSGYLLLLGPPAFVWLARRLYAFLAAPSKLLWRRAALGAGIALNCAVFFLAPLYCTYRGIREFERDLNERVSTIRRRFDPSVTIILGFDSHFLGYRHAGYYLPEYITVEYPEVQYRDGKRVFVMQGGSTRLARSFPSNGIKMFAEFPLPGGDDYSRLLGRVVSRLPQPPQVDLRVPYASGPVAALAALFPATMPQPDPSVYAPASVGVLSVYGRSHDVSHITR